MAIKGHKKHLARLKMMRGPKIRAVIKRELYVWADAIRVHAQHSIVQGAIQGKGHVASLPGEPPNRDTGQLDSSIVVRQDRIKELKFEVVADTPYAAALELGRADGSIAERPYMRPASAAQHGPGLARLNAAIALIIKSVPGGA